MKYYISKTDGYKVKIINLLAGVCGTGVIDIQMFKRPCGLLYDLCCIIALLLCLVYICCSASKDMKSSSEQTT